MIKKYDFIDSSKYPSLFSIIKKTEMKHVCLANIVCTNFIDKNKDSMMNEEKIKQPLLQLGSQMPSTHKN